VSEHHWALGLAIALCASTAAADEGLYSVDASRSSVTYVVVHKFHRVEGISKTIEGRARVLENGQVQAMVRVPVESFDSRNVNRDAHMKETLEAARFPAVELKAVGDGALPSHFPATASQTFKAQLSLHGVQQTFELPAQLTWEAANRVRVNVRFSVSLEAYRIARPSLMFVKIDDAVQIEAKLLFTK
jgi:polyisoprenoid-binding protein YceI